MKAPLVVATHNIHKVREIKKILGKRFPFALKTLEEFPPPYTVRETGKTLEANALLKARRAARHTGKAALADDTGLEVAALNGAPGVYSARFAGPGCTFEDNNRKLLRLLKGVPPPKRTALFRTVAAVVFPWGGEYVFDGRCPGWIALEARGKKGFGYDPVFQPAGKSKTFAEMSLAEKNRLSHRARAFKKAAKFLSQKVAR